MDMGIAGNGLRNNSTNKVRLSRDMQSHQDFDFLDQQQKKHEQ